MSGAAIIASPAERCVLAVVGPPSLRVDKLSPQGSTATGLSPKLLSSLPLRMKTRSLRIQMFHAAPALNVVTLLAP